MHFTPGFPQVSMPAAGRAPCAIASRPIQYHEREINLQHDRMASVKSLLDIWANWFGTQEALGRGNARQSLLAIDEHIQSIEDMEVESEKRIVRAVHACVFDLPKAWRDVVLKYYGFMHKAWEPGDDILFGSALAGLYRGLSARLAV